MKTNKQLKELYCWLNPKNCWTGDFIETNDDFIELDFMPMCKNCKKNNKKN